MTDDATPTRGRSVGRALLAIVEAPVVAAVLVGLLAAYLRPGPYWWAQLVAIGLPYASWVLAGFGALWLLGRRWRAVAFHAALLLIVGVRAGGLARLGAPADGSGDLVLTTFNVPESGQREALGDSVVSYVGATEPDLLLMQDARVIARSEQRRQTGEVVQVEAIRTRLPYALRLPARLASHPGWSVNSTDVPFFVHEDVGVEVVEQEVLILGVERDPNVSLALRSHLRWQDRDVVVYNVHLRSFGSQKPWQDEDVRLLRPSTWAPYLRRYRTVYGKRGEEAAEIADRIAQETLPVVVAGDFNSTADNWSTRRLRTAGGVDRTDAVQAAGGRGWGRTYHAQRPFVRIDFVFVDPALEVTSAHTDPVGFSDHRPVRVGLRWADSPDGEDAETSG